MLNISAEQIEKLNDFPTLIKELEKGFQSSIETPMRHHHDFANPKASQDSTLLLMPSWEAGENVGVKIVTVSPDNGVHDLPSIHGIYILFDAVTGQPKAMLDGTRLTAKRTAAASALASSYLSRKDASSLLMIGTGALAANLIQAHCSQRPITTVWVWGRTLEKAQAIVDGLKEWSHGCARSTELFAVADLDEYIPKADIISCATLSPTALIKGELLRAGQHIDLVGSYKKDAREANNAVMTRSSIFVDTFQGGLKESGDIVIPLKEGVISEASILGDLTSLTRKDHLGRTSDEEITVFKSVGHASEDLMAANYFYSKVMGGSTKEM
ncbi:MAG: ornithine cyclodeaminase family protein [Crocinitomicaceae bacterium]|nr:ornithine cyclodeaminase family protein [Crocinitomicaceae bacterium]